MKFAAINCESFKPLCQRLQVKFYPTLNLFLSKENQVCARASIRHSVRLCVQSVVDCCSLQQNRHENTDRTDEVALRSRPSTRSLVARSEMIA